MFFAESPSIPLCSEQRIAALEESALRERARLEDARAGAQRKAELAERELLALRKERDALDVRLRMERSVRKAAPSAAEIAVHGEDTSLLHRQVNGFAPEFAGFFKFYEYISLVSPSSKNGFGHGDGVCARV